MNVGPNQDASLVRLDASAHRDIRWRRDAGVAFAARRHMMKVQVREVAAASLRCPVFVSRVTATGTMSLSAVTSFTPGANLLVRDGKWCAPFSLMEMETPPFSLMPGDTADEAPVLCADLSDAVFSSNGDERIFDQTGGLSIPVQQIEKKLLAGVELELQTRAFLDRIDALSLVSPLTINLTYRDGEVVRIGGLSTINEDRLKSLPDNDVTALHRDGLMAPMFGMLCSIGQLNGLIQLHNAQANPRLIERINIEVTRDTASF